MKGWDHGKGKHESQAFTQNDSSGINNSAPFELRSRTTEEAIWAE